MNQNKKYPVGIQDFASLRNDGYYYLDKTELVYRLVTTGKYYFLSRPRRFGKSLLISTLEAYFEGRKDLFEGLALSTLEKDWKKYPVFHLDRIPLIPDFILSHLPAKCKHLFIPSISRKRGNFRTHGNGLSEHLCPTARPGGSAY